MRRARDLAFLRAGLYIATAISGFAAAYALKQLVLHLWDTRNRTAGAPPDSPGEKPSLRQDTLPSLSPTAHEPSKLVLNQSAQSVQSANLDSLVPTPSTSQSKAIPPSIRTHSLPPPLPSTVAQSLLSAGPDTTAPLTFPSSHGEDSIEQEGATVSETDSFIHVLSPPPTNVVRRHSVRAHDLFAESHISFSELGSLVAPPNDPGPK